MRRRRNPSARALPALIAVGAVLLLSLPLAWAVRPQTYYVNCDLPCPGNCLLECPSDCLLDDCPDLCFCAAGCAEGDPGCPAGCRQDCSASCPPDGGIDHPFPRISTALGIVLSGDTVLVLPTDDDPPRLRPECDPRGPDTIYSPEGNCSFCEDPQAASYLAVCCPSEPVFDPALCNPPVDCDDPVSGPDCALPACEENVSMVSGVDVISTAGPARTTIRAALSTSPVIVASSLAVDTTLDGFTVTGGGGRLGAGIQAIFGSPTITNNIIEANTAVGDASRAGRGGGIYLYLAGGEISGNLIRDNRAGTEVEQGGGLGGGIMTTLGTPVITRNIIAGNVALASPSQFSGYVYGYGGGVEAEFGAARITDNLIVGNKAGLGGGGICVYGGSPVIINNTIDGNCAGVGSGVLLPPDCASLAPLPGTFAYGGGIESISTVIPTIFNNAITGNISQGSGGGIDFFPEPGPALLRIQANLLFGNEAQADAVTDHLSGLRLCDDASDGTSLSERRDGFTCVDDSECLDSGGGGLFDVCAGGATLLARQIGGTSATDPAYLNPPPFAAPCDPTDPLDCDFHTSAGSVVDKGRDVIRECTEGPGVEDPQTRTGAGIVCQGDENLTFLVAASELDLDGRPRTIRLQSNPIPYLFLGTDVGAYEHQPGAASDIDNDGILEDGDGSGVPGDAPCTAGVKIGCDDNCATVANGGQLDSEVDDLGSPVGDGVGDACDRCKLVPDPEQGDLDGDGQGDLCDPDRDDDQVLEDGDGSGDPADNPCPDQVITGCDDNCPDVSTPSQFDSDFDLVGDSCDCAPLDASESEPPAVIETGLIFTAGSEARLEWGAADNADEYHLYRGSLAVLLATWEYTQDPSVVLSAAQFCDLVETALDDPFEPVAGEIVFYLVASANACGQTVLGEDSAGAARVNLHPCPF